MSFDSWNHIFILFLLLEVKMQKFIHKLKVQHVKIGVDTQN